MVTIICCYNNEEILQTMLIASLKRQKAEYKFIPIDSRKYKFSSAATAYNSILQNPKKYNYDDISSCLLFVHQDVFFQDIDFLTKIELELAQTPNDIIGLAGIISSGKVLSNLKYLNSQQYITLNQISNKTEVESVDECCFAMSKELWERLHFDSKACYHWHLYAVDICYNAKRNFGSKCVVIPNEAFHKKNSDNGLETDNHFLNTMWKLVCKYNKDYDNIYAPCYIVSTSKYKALFKLLRTRIKNTIKKVRC